MREKTPCNECIFPFKRRKRKTPYQRMIVERYTRLPFIEKKNRKKKKNFCETVFMLKYAITLKFSIISNFDVMTISKTLNFKFEVI